MFCRHGTECIITLPRRSVVLLKGLEEIFCCLPLSVFFISGKRNHRQSNFWSPNRKSDFVHEMSQRNFHREIAVIQVSRWRCGYILCMNYHFHEFNRNDNRPRLRIITTYRINLHVQYLLYALRLSHRQRTELRCVHPIYIFQTSV